MNSKEIEKSLAVANHYFKNNNYEFAEEILKKIIKVDKLNPKANELLAYIYGNKGKSSLSLHFLIAASQHPKCSAEALYYLGSALLHQQNFNSAAKSLELSLVKAGDFFEGLHDLGTAYAQLHKKEMALACYKRALTLKKDSYELFFNMGRLCDDMEMHEEAINYYSKSLKLNPLHIDSHLNKGVSLDILKKYKDALGCFDEAIRIDPDYAQAWCNKGATLNHLHRYKDAILHFNKALELSPQHLEALSNKGQALSELKKYDEALLFFNQALTINPTHSETINNKCLLNLLVKNFNEGWANFDIRLKITNQKYPAPTDLLPIWDGVEKIEHLLVGSEQGVGDQIFYSSFLANLHEYAKKITVLIDKRLVKIFSRSFQNIIFMPKEANVAPEIYNRQIIIGSIPSLLKINPIKNKLPRKPFLQAKNLSSITTHDLAFAGNKSCGLSWKSANQKIGEKKSLPLLGLKSILRNLGCTFVNLQYGEVSKEITEVKSQLGVEINQVDGVDLFEDIDGLLSIIDACDIVVTTSNVTAHLAGAIGKKTLLLVPYAQGRIWYWHDDEVSIWYPSIKQYFQDADLSWDNAINKIASELEQEIARKN